MAFVFGQHAQGGGYRFFWRIRFLVALTPAWDLLLRAKYLFVAATMAAAMMLAHTTAMAGLTRNAVLLPVLTHLGR